MRAINEREKAIKALDIVTGVLLIIGGLNWLVVGITGGTIDLVADTLGEISPWLAWIVYILVGLSAIVQAVLWKHVRVKTYEHQVLAHPSEPAIQH